MRRIGDAAWRYFDSYTDAGKAFNLSKTDVSKLINDPSTATEHAREFEARPAPAPKKRERYVRRSVEGAYQKDNGKWVNYKTFPGREFDDLDEYRAAKKQHAARRKEYSAQNGLWQGPRHRAAAEVMEAPPQRADVESVTV